MMRGLFGKKMQMPGMGAGFAGMGGGIVATPEQEAESARLAAMFPNAGMPQDEITYAPQAQAIMSGEAPMPAKQGFDWKNVLLQTLGGAADGAATFFGGEPVIRQNMQMQQMMAMRQAEEQRRRAAELADYRTKLGIKQEFAGPPEMDEFDAAMARANIPKGSPEYMEFARQYAERKAQGGGVFLTNVPAPGGGTFTGSSIDFERRYGNAAGVARRPVPQSDWDSATPLGGAGSNASGNFRP